jgi:integrase
MSNEKRKKGTPRRQVGYVFQKVNSKTGVISPYWTIQYFHKGKRIRKAAGEHVKTQAQEVLADRLAKVRHREAEETRKGKAVTVGQLYADLREEVETERNSRGKRSLQELGWRWAHLEEPFGKLVAIEVTAEDVRDYKKQRQREGAADATINRELATLRRMFNLAREEKKVRTAPYIKLITENNTRQGFLEDADFDRLAAQASGWMRCFLSLAYSYGWRRGELLGLRVRQIDLDNRTIRLETGTTKNGEGREVRMTQEVEQLLRVAVAGKHKKDD